jgi:hypothetical protein
MHQSFPLCLFAALAFGSTPAVRQDAHSDKMKARSVSGFLDAHWEYPNFLPVDLPGYQALPFQIQEERWREIYAKPDIDAMKYRPSETRCFLISGAGYVAPRRPTSMWPADKQFIFVKVRRLKQLKTDAKCVARFSRKVR